MSKTKSGGWKVSLAAVLKQHNATKGDAGHKGGVVEFGKNSTLRVLNAITLHNIQDCVFA
jgi:hypothetical protein